MDSSEVFVVFPYLKTRDRIRIRGIEFRSNRDLAELSSEIQGHLSRICRMFFAGDGVRIEQMTCAYLPLTDYQPEREKRLRHVYEAWRLIGYLYSSPRSMGDVFLAFENCSIFDFRQETVSPYLVFPGQEQGDRVKVLEPRGKPEDDMIAGYEGQRNNTVPLWVAEGSRIYPELPHVTLNSSQCLSDDVIMLLGHEHNWALRRLYLTEEDFGQISETRVRLFVGLDWYLRSCRKSISDAEALVNLAIGLESLLRVRPGAGLTERFKDAVITLLGPVPRLDSWLEQFYTARSKAVHEGIPHELMFDAAHRESLKKRSKDGERLPHRPLIEYGRRIFRLCLTTVLSGATNAQIIGLSNLFVHNRERLQNICEKLKKDGPPDNRLHDIRQLVAELREFSIPLMEPEVELSSILGAARLILQTFTESSPTLSETANQAIAAFLASKSSKSPDQLKALDEIVGSLYDVMRTNPVVTGCHTIVLEFLTYACEPHFRVRAGFENRQ